MRVHELVAAQRRDVADSLDALSPAQWARPTLCAGWTVHDVAAHLVGYLRFGQAKLLVGVAVTGGDVERVNAATARWAGRHGDAELVAALRRGAGSRMTVPRAGYDPVLADVVLHDLDIRVPLGLAGAIAEDRLWVAFNHLTTRPALGFRMHTRLDGLRVETTDTGWVSGAGPVVRGPAEDVLLGISGRTAGLDRLSGDGVPLLRRRVSQPPPLGFGRRAALALGVLLEPAAPERRSRAAEVPPVPEAG